MKKMRIVSFIAALALLVSMFVLPATASAAPAPPLTNIIIEGVFFANNPNQPYHPRQGAYNQNNRTIAWNTSGINVVRPSDALRYDYEYLVVCVRAVGTASSARATTLNGDSRLNFATTEILNSSGQPISPGQIMGGERFNVVFDMSYYTSEDFVLLTCYNGMAPYNTFQRSLWILWE